MTYYELLKLKENGELSNFQGKCPYCGGDLDYSAVQFEGESCYFPWKCCDCGMEGEEWYSLTFQGHNIYDNEGNQIEL